MTTTTTTTTTTITCHYHFLTVIKTISSSNMNNDRKGQKVYAGSLYIAKAHPSVWWHGLWWKLQELRMTWGERCRVCMRSAVRVSGGADDLYEDRMLDTSLTSSSLVVDDVLSLSSSVAGASPSSPSPSVMRRHLFVCV